MIIELTRRPFVASLGRTRARLGGGPGIFHRVRSFVRAAVPSIAVSRSIATGPRRVLSIIASVPVGVHQNLHFTRLVYLLGVLFVHTNNAVPAYQRIRLFRRFRESLHEGRVMNRREIAYAIVYTKPAVNIWGMPPLIYGGVA